MTTYKYDVARVHLREGDYSITELKQIILWLEGLNKIVEELQVSEDKNEH